MAGKAINKGAWAVWLSLMALSSVAVALVSYRYLIPGAPGAGPNVLANHFTHLGVLTVHAGFAATALLLGPFQFIAALRRRRPKLHRTMGTIYVIACLCGGFAGLFLAAGTTAGPVAIGGFGLLAGAWFFATAQAWRYARAWNFAAHRRWMIRSFAMTFAAVTLRIYIPISMMLHLPFAEAYPAIAWLAWVPNLIVAELYLSATQPKTSRAAAA